MALRSYLVEDVDTGMGAGLGLLKQSVYHTVLFRFLLRVNLNLKKAEKGRQMCLKTSPSSSFHFPTTHQCPHPFPSPPTGTPMKLA